MRSRSSALNFHAVVQEAEIAHYSASQGGWETRCRPSDCALVAHRCAAAGGDVSVLPGTRFGESWNCDEGM